VLPDGTIFLTGHLLPADIRNTWGYTCGFLHRSTDRGKTWTPGPDLSTAGAGGMGFQAIASDGRDVGIVFGSKNTIYYALNDGTPVVVAEAPPCRDRESEWAEVRFCAVSPTRTTGSRVARLPPRPL